MHKGSIIINNILYFYLPPNYYIYNNKCKKAISYTKASKALPKNPFIAFAFGALEPHLAYS